MALRLNLGSGDVPLPGFTNVDALEGAPGVDVIADLSEPLPFADGEADLIYAAHVLEHFSTDVVPRLLADWRRVLRPGGLLLVAVPDLEVIASMLVVDRPGWFTPPHNPWLGAIYGGQKDVYDFHKTGFTAMWLAHLLNEAGFGEIQQVDRFDEIGAADASFSPQPFGTNVSLNMRARAVPADLPADLFERSRSERALQRVDDTILGAMKLSTLVRSRVMRRRRARLERALKAGRQVDR
jgi:predicted SAM-dependent methyltransferase